MSERGKKKTTKPQKNHRSSKSDVLAQQYMGLMIQMRIEGKTFKEIADFVEMSVFTVHRLITEELAKRDKDIAERAGELRYIENERLDSMHKALSVGIAAGDPASINAGLNVMARRAKLFALDRPPNMPSVVTPMFILPNNLDVKGTEFEQPSDKPE